MPRAYGSPDSPVICEFHSGPGPGRSVFLIGLEACDLGVARGCRPLTCPAARPVRLLGAQPRIAHGLSLCMFVGPTCSVGAELLNSRNAVGWRGAPAAFRRQLCQCFGFAERSL
jgi:hypothetical protein